jgi:hypothetical protein
MEFKGDVSCILSSGVVLTLISMNECSYLYLKYSAVDASSFE